MRLISAASGVSMYRNATQFYQMARTYRLTSALPCIPGNWYGRKVKITKRTVYKDTERVQIMTSITTSLFYPKIIYHKQFLTEKIQLLAGK